MLIAITDKHHNIDVALYNFYLLVYLILLLILLSYFFRLYLSIFVFFFYLNKGDEIIKWNGHTLHGKSAHEVFDIIADSRRDTQVELIISRLILTNRRAAQASWRQSHYSPAQSYQSGTYHKKRKEMKTTPNQSIKT